MKKITLFMMKSCPYCIEALRLMDVLLAENPEYLSLDIEKIDERVHPEIARKYDYYYVPTFYIGNEKLHEGVVNIKTIRRVFDAALTGS